MSALSRLKRHPRRALRLFAAYDRAVLREARRKRELFDRLRWELQAHAEVAREILGPPGREGAPGRPREMERVLRDLSLMAPHEPHYDGKMKVLREWLERQTEEEVKAFVEARDGGDQRPAASRHRASIIHTSCGPSSTGSAAPSASSARPSASSRTSRASSGRHSAGSSRSVPA